MRKTKEEMAMHECYKRLFAESTPSADFDVLVENATINESGQKEIPFLDYEIDGSRFQEIVDETIKKYKFKGWRARALSVGIHLGCSPKSK
jgi:hypothetical protein